MGDIKRKPLIGGRGLMEYGKLFTPSNSPPPPGHGQMWEGTTGVTLKTHPLQMDVCTIIL